MAKHSKQVREGKWRTLETFWNVSTTGFFTSPAGAKIKVRYGVGIFGWDRQKQTLDGQETKRLHVGIASAAGARMQMFVNKTQDVTYETLPGDVAVEVKF